MNNTSLFCGPFSFCCNCSQTFSFLSRLYYYFFPHFRLQNIRTSPVKPLRFFRNEHYEQADRGAAHLRAFSFSVSNVLQSRNSVLALHDCRFDRLLILRRYSFRILMDNASPRPLLDWITPRIGNPRGLQHVTGLLCMLMIDSYT